MGSTDPARAAFYALNNNFCLFRLFHNLNLIFLTEKNQD